MRISGKKLEEIFDPTHFKVDYNGNFIGIRQSSSFMHIDETIYNDFIKAIPFERSAQRVYTDCLMKTNSNYKKHTSAERVLRELRFLWEKNPIFQIEEIREGDGVNTPVELKCREKVLLNIQSIAPASKFFK